MDLTIPATPGFFATMWAERRWLLQHASERGPTAADYEPNDTRTSLAMGTLSLFAPFVLPALLKPFTPGKGKFGKQIVGVALGAAAITTLCDRVVRATNDPAPARTTRRAMARRSALRARSIAAPTAVAAAVVATTAMWRSTWTPQRMWDRRVIEDRGNGSGALIAAILGWDFIYYWNHRLMHEARYMWAIHVVHHSSERYNLSTALRQPVADVFGTFIPYSALCLFGIQPELIETARAINLIYQYWIHTDVIRSLGPFEELFNTASHHRVHHGSNRQYLDRNHGSIFIIWDRMFGTFEREDEPVIYGLTKNVNSFNPAVVATHEHRDMLRDVAHASNWRDRVSFVVRGPGWSYQRQRELAHTTTT